MESGPHVSGTGYLALDEGHSGVVWDVQGVTELLVAQQVHLKTQGHGVLASFSQLPVVLVLLALISLDPEEPVLQLGLKPH